VHSSSAIKTSAISSLVYSDAFCRSPDNIFFLYNDSGKFSLKLEVEARLWVATTQIGKQLSVQIVEPWQVWRDNAIKESAIISNGGKSLHELYCTELGVVTTVICLIDSRCGAVRKLSTKRSSTPLWKTHGIVVSLNSGKCTKVAKLARFDIPTTLTIVSKNKYKINSHFFLSKYRRSA